MSSASIKSAVVTQSRTYRAKVVLLLWFVFTELVLVGAFRVDATISRHAINHLLTGLATSIRHFDCFMLNVFFSVVIFALSLAAS